MSLESDPENNSSAAPALIMQDDGTFRHERLWRGSAIALPVFALRTRDSVGAGEFEDLKKLCDAVPSSRYVSPQSPVTGLVYICMPLVRWQQAEGSIIIPYVDLFCVCANSGFWTMGSRLR